jgi:hypothetical protein
MEYVSQSRQKAAENIGKNAPHGRLVWGRDDTDPKAAAVAKDPSELRQPECRIRKELQAKLAYDAIEAGVPEWQSLTVGGYWPKELFVHPATRTFEHRRRDVRPDHEARRSNDWERHLRGLARSGAYVEHSAARCYLGSG